MARFTKVRGILCIAHNDHRSDPHCDRLHGHTYEVWATFLYRNSTDGDTRVLAQKLAFTLERWDHLTVIDTGGEELAELIATDLNEQALLCRKVELERRPEGIVAIWEA
jgi:hypothetical protein